MLYHRMRRAAAVCAALLSTALLSACEGAGGGPAQGADSTSAAIAANGEKPVALVVQMTGLLLLVPTNSGLEVLMPKLEGHDAFIGYKKANSTGCWGWDPARKICYQEMEGWTLDPIGMKGGSAPATSALNLTRGSGKKINLGQAKKDMRSGLTLGPGVEETCHLAEWTFDPVGDEDGPSRVQLVNVMKWQINDVGTNSIALKRKRVGGTGVSQQFATLTAENGEIQLFVMHIPEIEAEAFFKLTSVEHPLTVGSGNASLAGTGQNDHSEDLAMIEKHFHAFYNLMKVESGKRPIPTNLQERKEVCPITVLGLKDVFTGLADTTALEPKRQRPPFGPVTYSCVMVSAEPEG
jgi:hypothetical protein